MSITHARFVNLVTGTIYIALGVGILLGHWPSPRTFAAFIFIALGNLLARPSV